MKEKELYSNPFVNLRIVHRFDQRGNAYADFYECKNDDGKVLFSLEWIDLREAVDVLMAIAAVGMADDEKRNATPDDFKWFGDLATKHIKTIEDHYQENRESPN